MKQIKTLSVAQWFEACSTGAYLTVRIPLNGHSMRPLIRKNRDLVTIAPLRRDVRKGDIVLFHRTDGAYVVHRVLRLYGEQVVTLGDGCFQPDAPLQRSQLLGLVTHMKRGGRTIRLDTSAWRAAGRLWMWSLPVRRPLVRMLRGLKRRLFRG